MQALPKFLVTLPKFLTSLSAFYLKVMNLVLACDLKSQPRDLRVELDDAQYRVDTHEARTLFVESWNEATVEIPEAHITTFKWLEWQWILSHLLSSCRSVVANSVRLTFDEEPDEHLDYVGDLVSAQCTHTHTHTLSLSLQPPTHAHTHEHPRHRRIADTPIFVTGL